MTRIDHSTEHLLHRLRTAAGAVNRDIAFMEVCGTHTASAFRCGLPTVMPPNIRLISGPGCPVCVTSQSDIDRLIELGSRDDVVLCTYGDMLRVPGRRGNLENARTRGRRIEVVYSSMDALRLAIAEPHRQIVFAAVGFETTAPATAAVIREAKRKNIRNFSVMASHKRIIPAMRALMMDEDIPHISGFLCPGHVSVIIGAEIYQSIVDEFGVSCVIGGFEPAQLIASLAYLTELVAGGKTAMVNQYPEAVRPRGNPRALELLTEVFVPGDARWRGMGVIPESGLVLRNEYREMDAVLRFNLPELEERELPGCICGKVISGAALPVQCRLFGQACTPISPIGPCMVSSEGTCSAWFKYGRSGHLNTSCSHAAETGEVYS